MDSSKPSVASGVPSSARQAWHSGMGASPNIANRTQVPAQDLRAAGVDSSRQRSGVQDPGLYFAGPTQFAQVPQGYSQPAQWERVVGGYPMPPIVQSAYVPPVAGVYPPRQARYGTVPLPSQSSNPEPLFEAVNPFEARRWRQPARPTAPTEPQPPHADDYWAQVSPGPPVIPEHPIQRQPVQSATNPVWMPSPFIPVQPTQYQAYQPTQFQPYQQLQSTDPADNPAWLAPNTAGGGPLLNPAFPGQATVYPQTANYPAYAPAIPGSLPFQSFPQASRARVPFQRNDFESEDGSNEGIGRSKPYVTLLPSIRPFHLPTRGQSRSLHSV
ncbi:hypothetical protein C8R45DRAFT_277014 [Mycena sanguinolenta]|nr:hypothetical protein C8R45DRAFT_277014 [Mycena sanguinolenta]